MDITKCLTISTNHITFETNEKLDNECITDELGLAVYEKGDYGWWIYVGKSLEDVSDNVPDDLMECITLAWAYECEWLCLDQAAEEVDLPTYDW